MDFMNLVYTTDARIWCMLNVFLGSLSSPSFLVTLVQVFVLVCPGQFQSSKYVSESTQCIRTKSAPLFLWPLSISSDKLYFVGEKDSVLTFSETEFSDALMNFRRNYGVLVVLLWHWSEQAIDQWFDVTVTTNFPFLAFPVGEMNGNLYQIEVELTKHRVNSPKTLWDENFNVIILIFPLWNNGDLSVFPLSNKPFHDCIGEIQVFLDGPIGYPRKRLLCVLLLLTLLHHRVQVKFTKELPLACQSGQLLCSRNRVLKKEKTKRTETSAWGWGWRSDRFLSRNRRPA